MQKGHKLSFPCTKCSQPISFNLRELEKTSNCELACESCQKHYLFEEGTLLKQIKSFLNLMESIRGAEEILSLTTVGVKVGDKEVQIPYKLLLTRLTSYLSIQMDGKVVNLSFRSEPLKD